VPLDVCLGETEARPLGEARRMRKMAIG